MGKLLKVFLLGMFFLFLAASCSDDDDNPTEPDEINNDVNFSVSNESLEITVSHDSKESYDSGESPLFFTSTPSVNINVTEYSGGSGTLTLKNGSDVIYSETINSTGSLSADLNSAPTTGRFTLSGFQGKATITVD